MITPFNAEQEARIREIVREVLLAGNGVTRTLDEVLEPPAEYNPDDRTHRDPPKSVSAVTGR